MDRLLLRFLAIALVFCVAACHRQANPPGDPPGNVKVKEGDGVALVSWDQFPDLTYWIFYQAGGFVAPAVPGVPLIRSAQSPRVVSGLVNGTGYAFVMNATNQDSPAGPASPVIAGIIPRLAGATATWKPGAPLPPGAASFPNLNAVIFSGTRLVAVGDTGTLLAGDYNYASDNPPGVTAWLSPTSVPAGIATKNFGAAVFTGAAFVALARDGSVFTSSDGLTWTAANPIPTGGALMNGLALGASVFVAVGSGGSIGNIFTSVDGGTTWTQPASNTTIDLNSVAFVGGIFIATGTGGTLLTSPNGSTWTPAQNSGPSNALRGAAFGLIAGVSRYVAVGDAGTIVTSTDGGATWSAVAPPFAQSLRGVVFGTRFLAVGDGGVVAYSDNGVDWIPASAGSTDLSAVIFTPGMYVAVGAVGANAVSR